MPVTYAHGRTHATVAFSGALDRAGAGELVDVVDLLVGHYFYARLELVVTSGGGDTNALEYVLGAMRRWERAGVRLCTVAIAQASSAAAVLVSLGTERVAAPRARLLYHHVQARARGESVTLSADEARAMAEGLVRTNARFAERLAERALRESGETGSVAASAELSDRAVLERLAGRGARRRARQRDDARAVRRLVRALGRRVEGAVARGDAAALARLYLALADVDAPISAVLARTLRLIDRVGEPGLSSAPACPEAAHETLVVPQWTALYPPDGAVPVAALSRRHGARHRPEARARARDGGAGAGAPAPGGGLADRAEPHAGRALVARGGPGSQALLERVGAHPAPGGLVRAGPPRARRDTPAYRAAFRMPLSLAPQGGLHEAARHYPTW